MKNIITHTKLGASLTALAFSTILVPTAQAQTCTAVPTCEELGYDKAESDCATTPLKCPFDKTKCHCLTVDELGELGGSKKSSCETPQIGDILYSDMSCSSSLGTAKTPIAVIFDSTFRLAIALQTESKAWSTESFEIPDLKNISVGETYDWGGKINTNIAVKYCAENDKSCPAFEYVNTYVTEGTKAGDWYLPAIGELSAIYSNLSVLNRSLSFVGGTVLPRYYHWSSSQHSSGYAWEQSFNDGNKNYIYNNGKGSGYHVRPVLQF